MVTFLARKACLITSILALTACSRLSAAFLNPLQNKDGSGIVAKPQAVDPLLNNINSSDDQITRQTVKVSENQYLRNITIDLGRDFRALSICLGKTIYGRSGTAVCLSGGPSAGNVAASSADILAGHTAWGADGRALNGAMVDRGPLDLQNSDLPAGANGGPANAGFYSSLLLNLDPSAVCQGNSILGQPGQALCNAVFSLVSNAHHDVGSGQIDTNSEIASGVDAFAGYRSVPQSATDDEGYFGAAQGCTGLGAPNDFCTPVQKASRPAVNCGNTGTVDDRIGDCAAKNGAAATWDGPSQGNSAESTWKLVTRLSDAARAYEVWRDEKTQLLWSDELGDLTNNAFQGKFNWCVASGNTQYDTEGGLLCKPNYVSGISSHNYSGISLCYDDGPGPTSVPAGMNRLASEPNSVNGYSSAGLSDSGQNNIARAKGNLPARWRLPTRADWMQAEIDGARHVLPNLQAEFWAATVVSDQRDNAWLYDGTKYGIFSSTAGSDVKGVRCIGR